MKRLFPIAMGFVMSAAILMSAGMARAEMVKGEVTKISGDMVDIKDAKGAVHTVHNDPSTTKRTGEVKVGAMVEADVTSMGHANSITVKTKEEKKEMKKKTKEEKKEMKEEKK